jgi:hypothetical protein
MDRKRTVNRNGTILRESLMKFARQDAGIPTPDDSAAHRICPQSYPVDRHGTSGQQYGARQSVEDVMAGH